MRETSSHRSAPRILGGLFTAALLALAATLAPRWLAASWHAIRVDPLDVGAEISLLASAGFLFIAARMLLGLVLVSAGAALGRRRPGGALLARCGARMLPAFWKPVALIVAGSLGGVTLTACSPPAEPAAASSPAWAVTSAEAPAPHPADSGTDPGWQAIARADPRPEPAHHAAPKEPPIGGPRHVVVERGDTLWSLAAESLAARDDGTPAAASVEESWRRWYSANRRIIGDDPDLLIPGQRLTEPADPIEPEG